MSYTIDLKNEKVVIHFDQDIPFSDILSEYTEQTDGSETPLTDERALEVIQKIAKRYDETAEFGWDDMYLEEAVWDVIKEEGGDICMDDDEEDEEDDDEDAY